MAPHRALVGANKDTKNAAKPWTAPGAVRAEMYITTTGNEVRVEERHRSPSSGWDWSL
jgi:hypothetical protein